MRGLGAAFPDSADGDGSLRNQEELLAGTDDERPCKDERPRLEALRPPKGREGPDDGEEENSAG